MELRRLFTVNTETPLKRTLFHAVLGNPIPRLRHLLRNNTSRKEKPGRNLQLLSPRGGRPAPAAASPISVLLLLQRRRHSRTGTTGWEGGRRPTLMETQTPPSPEGCEQTRGITWLWCFYRGSFCSPQISGAGKQRLEYKQQRNSVRGL